MGGQHANDDGFEVLKLLAWNQTFFNSQFGGEQAAQRVTLIDRKSANHTARIGDRLEPLSLSRRQSHFNPPFHRAITIEGAEYKGGAFECYISSLRRRRDSKNLPIMPISL